MEPRRLIRRALKPSLGILVAALYIAALSWLVRSEGERYRHELELGRAPSTGVNAQLRRPSAKLERGLPPDQPTESGAEPAASPPSDSTPPPSPLPAAVAKPDPKQTIASTPTNPREKSLVDPSPPDLRGLSSETLREIGDKLHEMIKSDHPLVNDRDCQRRLDHLARPLRDEILPGPVTLQFHILDSQKVNAFSHVGGHVYVSRGVFNFVPVDGELEFVIAHELAHLRLRHEEGRLAQVARQAGASSGRMAWLHFVLALGFSDDQEFEADALAFDALRKLERSPRAALNFLRRYSAYVDDHLPFPGNSPPASRPGDLSQDLENHFPAHPPPGARLAQLEASKSPAKKDRASAGSRQSR
jgi:predicted Zn-dependent protease